MIKLEYKQINKNIIEIIIENKKYYIKKDNIDNWIFNFDNKVFKNKYQTDLIQEIKQYLIIYEFKNKKIRNI